MTTHHVEACGSCGASVIRAIHERTLKPSVIDAEAGTVGNIVLLPSRNEQRPPTYRILPVAAQFGRRDLHTSHFASCPHAGSWRSGKRGAA